MNFSPPSSNPLPRAIDFASLRRALVIKLRHHGDVLLASPVFTALKAAAPQCEIDALVYQETAPMLTGHPAISCIHVIDQQWKNSGLFRQAKAEISLFKTLRGRSYDLLIHLTDHWRGAWLARLLRPSYSVALLPTLRPQTHLWRASFTHLAPLPPLGNRHTIECHLDALRAIGHQPSQPHRRLVFNVSAAAHDHVARLLAKYGITPERMIHVHPASRWMFKTWTAAGFAEVIAALAEQGFIPVVTSGPAEKERAFIAQILTLCRQRPIDFSGQLSIEELGALIANARLSLCVDSAPMHLAAAVGTPVVALFGPSNENEWGPWQVPHRVISSAHPCRPCRLDGCGGGKIADCLAAITAPMVLDAIRELLAETA